MQNQSICVIDLEPYTNRLESLLTAMHTSNYLVAGFPIPQLSKKDVLEICYHLVYDLVSSRIKSLEHISSEAMISTKLIGHFNKEFFDAFITIDEIDVLYMSIYENTLTCVGYEEWRMVHIHLSGTSVYLVKGKDFRIELFEAEAELKTATSFTVNVGPLVRLIQQYCKQRIGVGFDVMGQTHPEINIDNILIHALSVTFPSVYFGGLYLFDRAVGDCLGIGAREFFDRFVRTVVINTFELNIEPRLVQGGSYDAVLLPSGYLKLILRNADEIKARQQAEWLSVDANGGWTPRR